MDHSHVEHEGMAQYHQSRRGNSHAPIEPLLLVNSSMSLSVRGNYER